MMPGWNEPLPADEREKLIESVADAVVRRGLAVPAITVLELHRPIAFTLSQGTIALVPLFGPLIGLERMRSWSRLMAEPDGIEALIRRIEDKAVAPTAPSATTTEPTRGEA